MQSTHMQSTHMQSTHMHMQWVAENVAFKRKRLIIERQYKNADNCAICLDEMYQTMCEYLPCKHVFHYKCLHQLITQGSYTCPLCRADFQAQLKMMGLHGQQLEQEREGQVVHRQVVQNTAFSIEMDEFTLFVLRRLEIYYYIRDLLRTSGVAIANEDDDLGEELDADLGEELGEEFVP